jgi:hypothetical protein
LRDELIESIGLNTEIVIKRIPGYRNVCFNEEDYCSNLLFAITKYSRGRFNMTKGMLGSCWCLSCEDVLKARNLPSVFCAQCYLCNKDLSIGDKLRVIIDNSFPLFFESFSEVIDYCNGVSL